MLFRLRLGIYLLVVALTSLAIPVGASDFPPITAEERALTDVPFQPGAAAVVLFVKAEVKLMDYPEDVTSSLEVHTRLKVLKEEGKQFGDVAIAHSGVLRLKKFEGRTVLPDGRELGLTEESVFLERSSRAKKSFVTKAAFPGVEIGSIIDYRYLFRWDDLAYLEPWFFNNAIPTILSEISYHKPKNMALGHRSWAMGGGEIQSESRRSPEGVIFRVWMEDLIAIPDEPASFPFADLASRFMMIPNEVFVNGTSVPLFDSWRSACRLFEESDVGYKQFRRGSREAKKLAKKLTATASNQRDMVAAIYAYVRDEIRDLPSHWISVGTGDADKVLTERQGLPVEKAVLLQAMLEGIKTKPQLVWVSDKREGRADLLVANPWWFEKVLVMIEVAGERVFLDPGDRRLGFGSLSPYTEGTSAVLHGKKPEIITLPVTPFENNLRRAQVDLSLDDVGRVAGTGSLLLSGHHAWRFLRWKDDAAATIEAWQERLGDDFQGYDVSNVVVEEALDDRRVQVAWAMEQRSEEVLGDEASLVPSLPLGPIEQLFGLPPERRMTPVQMAFADRDEVELRVTWPGTWEIDLAPTAAEYAGPAGALQAQVEIDRASRQVTYSRRLDITAAEFIGRQQYAAVRDLYAEAERHDAQGLVWVRR